MAKVMMKSLKTPFGTKLVYKCHWVRSNGTTIGTPAEGWITQIRVGEIIEIFDDYNNWMCRSTPVTGCSMNLGIAQAVTASGSVYTAAYIE